MSTPAPSIATARTTDGLSLKAYYWPSTQNDKDVIIYLHGRNWTANRAANSARYLSGAGNTVLVASYRGFDDNPGEPSQAGLITDAEAFIHLAAELTGPDARIWLVGHSLGAAVALHVAGRSAHIQGLILLSPFTSITDMVPKIARSLVPDQWNNLTALRQTSLPVIIIQGRLDRFVPAHSGDTLFEASTGPASLIMGAQSRHNPDMALLSSWISQVIASAEAGSLEPIPTPPSGWIEKVRRP